MIYFTAFLPTLYCFMFNPIFFFLGGGGAKDIGAAPHPPPLPLPTPVTYEKWRDDILLAMHIEF